MASSEEEEPQSQIIIPEPWVLAADAIAYDSITSPPPVILICGAKNSGKTTFSRYLVNVLIQRYKKVAYLDTDVGQSEFTPPGCLSLTVIDKLTPDLAIPCLKSPLRCYYFGDTSSKRDPKAYLDSVYALYDYYRQEYCTSSTSNSVGKLELPLVINTPGWVKGIGYEMLVEMLKYISPSHVVKINISTERKNLPAGAFWLNEDDLENLILIELNSALQDSSIKLIPVQKNSKLLRDLKLMAYFRQCFQSDRNITTIKELAHALAAHPPFEVPISRVKIRHLHCEVPTTVLYHSLNASIVGLAVDSKDSGNLPCTVGLGIIRGIDTLRQVLYIITPVPQSTLEDVDLLLQGFIQIPTCLLQIGGCMAPYMIANALPFN
ncbi:Polyribonucleotide 5'-hydroxyl-kinase Clp1, P-loop domain [Dillenia turbinata]|uniref:Polyribonucleotide 5'-hydroxyl-kinase Clp1, P-loop domain n=1 Tax=Dillenia turbinata TaxID=194707 RepID=A0AAN8Z4W8_9MAGN